jgi:TIR domain
MSGEIFISYRREDSWGIAVALCDRLRAQFGPKQIFMDLDSVDLGENFVQVIETTVVGCDVLLAVIGNNWLNARDEAGGRRLDNPLDWVRTEVGTAIGRQIRVIPILVGSALMPRSTDLPEDLRPLASLNALRLTSESLEGDLQRLAGAIRKVLERVAAKEQERLAAEQREKDRLEAGRLEKERLEAEQREKERLEAERLEKERLAAEREKQRLVAEQREKERLEAEQREKERLEAEQREKERLEAKLRGKERVDAELREKERLEAERRPKGEDERQEVERKQPERILTPEHPRLRLLERLSFVAFALFLLSWLLPFEYMAPDKRDWTGAEMLYSKLEWEVGILEQVNLLSAFLCALFLVTSRFLKYRWKAILDLVVAWVGFVSAATYILFPFELIPLMRIGSYLACTFAGAGAVMKTLLFIYRRKAAEA